MPSDSAPGAITEEVARLIKEERLRQDLSMSAVALRAGLSQQMVSYVESGMRQPTLDTLLRICGVLKIPLWTFIKRAEKQVAGIRKAKS